MDFDDYLISWGQIYLTHFGAWVSFCFGTQIYKNGLPELKNLPSMFKVAVLLALFLSVFSSHSHNHYHYLQNLAGK